MARPKKLALDSFPFSVDFFHDEKVVGIDGEFGSKGVLAMVLLMCAIYRSNGYFMHWNAQVCAGLADEAPSISPELLNAVVLRLVKLGFFDRGLFGTAKVLTSKAIQRRYFAAVRRRSSWHLAPYVFPDVVASDSRPKGSADTERIPVPPADSHPPIPDYTPPPPDPASSTTGSGISPIDPGPRPASDYSDSSDYPDSSDSSDPRRLSLSSSESAFLVMPDDDRYEFLARQQAWTNSICRTYALSPQQLHERIMLFKQHCINEGKRHFYLHDMKAHFNRWCRLYSNTHSFTSTQNETTRKDQFSRRRPSDPSAHSPDDYTATL